MPGPGTATDGFLDGPRFRATFSGVTHASPSLLPDSPPDEGFDRLTRLAARLLGAPSAMITFLRDDHAFFQSAVGLPEPWATRRRAPLSLSFCRHIVTSGAPLVVDDARRHPLVRSSPAIRELGWIAYAGVPLAAPGGHPLGALAVADSLPRLWSPRDVALLEDLAASVMAELELRSRPPAETALAPTHEAPPRDPAARVFDASALPMGLILPDGRWLRVNRALAGLLGTTPEALTGCPAEAFTHPDDRTADREAVRLLLAGECASYSAEKRLLRQGEEPVWVVSTVTLLPGEDGTPGPLHAAFHDITDRKQGELDLRLREERYRVAAESTRDAVWDWDLLTDRIVWGERSAGRFGYRRHGGGTSAAWWYERLHPDDRERVVSGMQTAIARAAEEWTEEYRFRRADGSWAHVRSRAAIVRDEAGDAVRLVGAVQDVTEEVRAALLARGQSRLLEQIAVGLELPAVLDRIARFAEAHGSDLVACVLLLEVDAGLLRPAAAPSLPSEVRAALARPVTSREPVVLADLESAAEMNGRGPLLDLGLRALWSTPLIASDGGLLGMLDLYCREARAPDDGDTLLMEIAGHLAEIAIERERGQEALARGTRVLEQVLDSLPIGVWVLDGEGSIIFGNPAARAIWSGARYVGLSGLGAYRGWRVDTGAPIAAEQWGAARAILQGETSLDELVRIEAFDGAERTILSSAVPLRSLAGEVVGAILLHQDVSEQRKGEEALRRSEAQLRHAQKMEAVGQLAGGIAHDFNNLLTGILSYADLVLGELRPGDPVRADLEQIRHAAQRAAALTRQLLAFSRRQVLQPHVLSLNSCVAELDAMLRRLLGADVTLDTELDPGLWYVQADPGQLEQVLVNLVVNARDAMPSRRSGDDRHRQPSALPRGLRHPQRERHRDRDGRGHPIPHLRPVLHDQGAGQGYRTGALDRVRDRGAERRPCHGRERAGAGRDVHDLLPAAQRPRARPPARGRSAESPRRDGDPAAGGGRGRGAHLGAAAARAAGLQRGRSPARSRRPPDLRGGRPADRPGADRPRDAGDGRAGAGRAAARPPSRGEGALHVGLQRAGGGGGRRHAPAHRLRGEAVHGGATDPADAGDTGRLV